MKATVQAPGTCGELVQGTLDGINFLITCPVNSYSRVTVELLPEKTNNFKINIPHRYKIIEAVKKTMLKLTGELQGANIYVSSKLPVGKGMASSTADIAAACYATAEALQKNLLLEDLAKIALDIEPTDGIFFPDIVAFDHLGGTYYKYIGKAVPMNIIIFDCGGEIDTITFNKRSDLKEKNLKKEDKIKKAFALVQKGLAIQSPELVAEGATISALANQDIINKPELENILEEGLKRGIIGINIAHSGTLIGLLCRKDKVDFEKIVNDLTLKYKNLEYKGMYSLINGGLDLIDKEEIFCNKFGNMEAILEK